MSFFTITPNVIKQIGYFNTSLSNLYFHDYFVRAGKAKFNDLTYPYDARYTMTIYRITADHDSCFQEPLIQTCFIVRDFQEFAGKSA